MERKKSRIEGLIRAIYRHWKRSTAKTSDPCPCEEILACFVEGLLSKKEEEEVKSHLIVCDRCTDAALIAERIKNNSILKYKIV